MASALVATPIPVDQEHDLLSDIPGEKLSRRERARLLRAAGVRPLVTKAISKSLEKTDLCKHFATAAGCHYGDSCTYAHSFDELSKRPDLERTKLCRWFPLGRCRKKDQCRFAHSTDDVREAPAKLSVVCRFFPNPPTPPTEIPSSESDDASISEPDAVKVDELHESETSNQPNRPTKWVSLMIGFLSEHRKNLLKQGHTLLRLDSRGQDWPLSMDPVISLTLKTTFWSRYFPRLLKKLQIRRADAQLPAQPPWEHNQGNFLDDLTYRCKPPIGNYARASQVSTGCLRHNVADTFQAFASRDSRAENRFGYEFDTANKQSRNTLSSSAEQALLKHSWESYSASHEQPALGISTTLVGPDHTCANRTLADGMYSPPWTSLARDYKDNGSMNLQDPYLHGVQCEDMQIAYGQGKRCVRLQ
eukprot:TRINITY_DN22241_c0_g2_i1.p1 TRINITY_DN22241_c0_g2~~TRINITY_DN22241_c0_g2_i1.p1  ORF type:complete len:418 (-),score=21.87 TRINITY_DN22241_c0_g2_i1:277-1530(-)